MDALVEEFGRISHITSTLESGGPVGEAESLLEVVESPRRRSKSEATRRYKITFV
jgi:hypothetical protein